MPITTHARTVYRAPTAGRDYLTAKSAAWREADAIIRKRHPNEPAGDITDGFAPGWRWHEDPHLAKVHARLMRMLLRQLRVNKIRFK